MTTESEPGAAPLGDPSAPVEVSTPKRGAFPTPKSEIEKAKPYVPTVPSIGGCPEMRPAAASGKKED